MGINIFYVYRWANILININSSIFLSFFVVFLFSSYFFQVRLIIFVITSFIDLKKLEAPIPQCILSTVLFNCKEIVYSLICQLLIKKQKVVALYSYKLTLKNVVQKMNKLHFFITSVLNNLIIAKWNKRHMFQVIVSCMSDYFH